MMERIFSPASDEGPARRVAAIAARLEHLGAGYDAEPMFPSESMQELASAGLHQDFAPQASGGMIFASEEERHREMFDVLRAVGRADLSVGRLYEGHVNAMALFDWYGTAGQHSWLCQELRTGAFYGVWATEPLPGVHLNCDGEGRLCLEGSKTFASGAGGLAHCVITVQGHESERRMVVVRANEAARADLSQWRVRGMRASVSGCYDVTGLEPDPAALLGGPGDYDRDPRFTTGAWRFTAVQLGGIEALLTETRTAMSQTAREDPLQRAKFAHSVAATRTAYLWVRECALRAARNDPDGPAFARMTRGIVERAALDVMELAARIVGTRSAMDGQRIDKIIRDLSLYLRQAGPDYARDQAAIAWLERDAWGDGDGLW